MAYLPLCIYNLAGQSHIILLGRSFLKSFLMQYKGRTGSVTIPND